MAPNLGEHAPESLRDILFSYDIRVCFVLAFDVLGLIGLVEGRTRGTICESCNTPFDEVIDIV